MLLLRTLFARKRDDSGSALVAVVGVVVVLAIVGATLVATTIFNSGVTSATRANVQAQAAAEGGIDAVRAALPSCVSGIYSSPAGVQPQYTATVWHRSTATAPWGTPGCPAATSTQVRIVAVGTAQTKGVLGQSGGDTATMEAVFDRTPAGPPPPEFPRAVVGDKKISTVTGFTLGAPAGPPDMATTGDFTCNTAMANGGQLYVGGKLTATGGCNPGGSVYVRGDFYCSDSMTITGDLAVEGDVTFASTSCRVTGKLWAGGTLSAAASGHVGGNLWVKGSLTGEPLAVGGTSVRVGGAITSAARSAYEPRLTQPDSSLAKPDVSTMYDAGTFPHLKASDARWSTFTAGSWRTLTEAKRPESWINVCSIQGTWTQPVTITSNTKLDTTGTAECPAGLTIGGDGFTFELKADLVLVVNGFTQIGNIKVQSGDGAEHSLWIVHPWGPTQTACPLHQYSIPAPNVQLNSGTWTQDQAKIRVMLYSATGVHVGTTPALRGQVYGCNVNLATAMTLSYAPVGTTVSTAPVGPATFTLISKRDVTG